RLPEALLVLIVHLFTLFRHDIPPFVITGAIMAYPVNDEKMGLIRRLPNSRSIPYIVDHTFDAIREEWKVILCVGRFGYSQFSETQ
ncbi:MAG TPA: hypothetical protein VJL10_09365, partial [Anaerolineales bacterium]|nr:hypothetical protein [Anaerolineales bacterium]